MRFLGGLREVLSRLTSKPKSGQVPSERRLADDLRRSGLFDEDWYLSQLDSPLSNGEDPSSTTSAPVHIAASLPSHVSCLTGTSAARTARRTRMASLHPLCAPRSGPRNSPHPLFDAKLYLCDHPESETDPGGPLGHYLHRGWLDGARPSARFDPSAYRRAVGEVSGPPLADFARRVGTLLRATRGHEHLPRTTEYFDPRRPRPCSKRARAIPGRAAEPAPLVSIVVPTKDRAAGVVQPIRSVIEQTYPHWELIVVDDGSTDSTVRH